MSDCQIRTLSIHGLGAFNPVYLSCARIFWTELAPLPINYFRYDVKQFEINDG